MACSVKDIVMDYYQGKPESVVADLAKVSAEK